MKATRLSRKWVADATRQADVERRRTALDAIEDALRGDRLDEKFAALVALRGIGSKDIESDSWRFRDLVMASLSSTSPALRQAAPFALHALGCLSEAKGDILALASDPSPIVRGSIVRYLQLERVEAFDEAESAAVVKVLRDADPKVVRRNLNGLMNAKVSQHIEDCLLDLAQHSRDERIRASAR